MPITNPRAIYFPYCLKKLDSGSWVLLNRNYKPLGFITDDFIDYSDYPISMKITGLGKKTLEKLAWNKEIEGDIYLYNDATVPTLSAKNMAAYLKKLEIILKLKPASYRSF